MLAPHARKKGGSGTITSKKFADQVTMDHIVTRDLKDHGLDGERFALVIKDVYLKFRYIYPAEAKGQRALHQWCQGTICRSTSKHLRTKERMQVVPTSTPSSMAMAQPPQARPPLRRVSP